MKIPIANLVQSIKWTDFGEKSGRSTTLCQSELRKSWFIHSFEKGGMSVSYVVWGEKTHPVTYLLNQVVKITKNTPCTFVHCSCPTCFVPLLLTSIVVIRPSGQNGRIGQNWILSGQNSKFSGQNGQIGQNSKTHCKDVISLR